MVLRTQYEFLFVGRDEGGFVENYAYDLGEGSDNSGKIFINLEIQNNPAEAEAIGDTMFDTLRKTFFADLEKEPYLRFEDAVKVVNKALSVLKEEKASKYLGNINAVIAAIVGNTLFLTQAGDAEAYLVRRKLLSNVSDGLQDENSEDAFNNIASGTLESGDIVIVNSTRLLRYVSKSDLAKLVSGKNMVASLAELKDFLSSEVLSRIGLIGISVVEAIPSLSDKEKGQIVTHLLKEDINSVPETLVREKSGGSVKETVSKLTRMVSDLKNQVVGLARPENKVVRNGLRSSARSESSSFAIGGWGKEKILTALIILVVILTVGIWWLRSRAAEQAEVEKYSVILSEVREEISSAETTGQYNKDQAGQMLNHAFSRSMEVLNSQTNRAKANEMLKLIQDQRDKLDGVVKPQVRVLADLILKRTNVSAMGLIGVKDKMYAYEYNALYPVLLDKVLDPLTIDENEKVLKGVYYGDQESVLFYTQSGKMIEYKDNTMSFVDSADGVFKKGVDFQAYNNNVYVVDPTNNQIWKYTRRRDKFDAAVAWNVNGDVKNGVSIAIDGNIYVLNKDGSISKLFNGNKMDFPIKKQPIKPLTNPTKIYTELDMSQIYVLEPSTSRVLVFYKDNTAAGGATYSSQYVFDDLKDLRDVYVDKNTNKMYLLDATKIYEVVL
jgi:hypothetical protein